MSKQAKKAFVGMSAPHKKQVFVRGKAALAGGKRVFVGMSGGVDSSVAAYLLKKQGYDVTGVFLRSYNLDGCAERDAEDARRVAEHISIPFYVWDCEEEYKKKVVDYMVKGYARGETPNPDVMCNKEIKFGIFYEKALAIGADFVATGHYVRLKQRKNIFPSTRFAHPAVRSLVPRRAAAELKTADHAGAPAQVSEKDIFSLYQAADGNKDQSYFLWTLTQRQLAHCLFPIGEYTKPEVREIARKAGLPTAEKKDSQGICFLGQVSLGDFLKDYIKSRPGEVVDTEGRKIGEHDGAEFYTIGQRHGLNLGMTNKELGIRGAVATKPYYVAEKDIATNTVVVAEGDDNPALFRNEIELVDVNFINPPEQEHRVLPVMARVRYRQPLVAAVLSLAAGRLSLKFAEPVKFVARGQSAVFYAADEPSCAKASDGREMLGGGVIA